MNSVKEIETTVYFTRFWQNVSISLSKLKFTNCQNPISLEKYLRKDTLVHFNTGMSNEVKCQLKSIIIMLKPTRTRMVLFEFFMPKCCQQQWFCSQLCKKSDKLSNDCQFFSQQ